MLNRKRKLDPRNNSFFSTPEDLSKIRMRVNSSFLTCLGNTPLSYNVIVKSSALEQCAIDLSPTGSLKKSSSSKLVIITDTNVWKWHGNRLMNALEKAGAATPKPLIYILEPGEGSKSRATKEKVEDFMLSNRCLRDCFVLAFGGGVVGDLAGFVASTYMRGVPVIQLPTTLLAMVDSSVGGKTGVDTPAGKNFIGAFHQPKAVYADPTLLMTLPAREIANGMAEVVKCGLIADADLFDLCESRADDILGKEVTTNILCDASTGSVLAFLDNDKGTSNIGNDIAKHSVIKSVKTRLLDLALLESLVHLACAVKVRVVSQDEKEGGIRSILNFGHTVGHGIEALMQPTLLHGECVAIGMVIEVEVSRALGHCETLLVARLKRVLSALKLPFRVPVEVSNGIGLQKCIDKMAIDKKNVASDSSRVTRCVLLKSIGYVLEPPYTHAVQIALVMRLMSAAVSVRPCKNPSSTSTTSSVTLHVPGSKSLSNRVLLLAALAKGTTIVRGLLHSDDTDVMLRCLSDIGAKAKYMEVDGKTLVEVTGTGGAFCLPPRNPTANGGLRHLYVQNAGTASRFLTAVLCLLPISETNELEKASLSVTIGGNARMAERPIGPLVDALRAQGAQIEYLGGKGCMPLAIRSGISAFCDSRGNSGVALSSTSSSTSHSLTNPKYRRAKRRVFLEAKLSSQYVSAILMAAPFFPQLLVPIAEGDLVKEDDKDADVVEVVLAEEKPTSLPYIDMTVSIMCEFGVNVIKQADNCYLVPRSTYIAPNNGHDVEADASSASYPAAIAAVTGTVVVLDGVGNKSVQGDARFPALLGRMGCKVEESSQSITVTGPAAFGGELVGIDVNMSEQTDCFMTLAVVAAIAKGTTRITGIANQRVKECNRIAAMVAELAKCGITARELPDGIEIEGAKEKLHGATIHCYDDHRIAMSFAVLGLSSCLSTSAHSLTPMVLDEALCVGKTYSEFWDDLEKHFKASVEAAEVTPLLSNIPTSLSTNSSIVLIGMRCAGKSTLARSGAASLGSNWQHVDLDRELEKEQGCSISDVITKNGWSGFRELEAKLLKASLSSSQSPFRHGYLISCGGGVVETEEGREILKNYVKGGGAVIEIRRDIDDISVSLGEPASWENASNSAVENTSSDSLRPSYPGGATARDVYTRRKVWYATCSSHVFSIIAGEGAIGSTSSTSWNEIEERFGSFVKRIVTSRTGAMKALVNGKEKVNSQNDSGTGFLCLAVKNILDVIIKEAPSTVSSAKYPHCRSIPTADLFDALSDSIYKASLDASAIEIRVDCLRPANIPEDQTWSDDEKTTEELDAYVVFQIALLRLCLLRGKARSLQKEAKTGSNNLSRNLPHQATMPIIFTVRTAFEGGQFKGSEKGYERLCRLACRLGCESIDLESGRCDDGSHSRASLSSIAAVAHSYGVTVLGSAHWPNSALPPSPETGLLAAAQNCISVTRADIVKLVVATETVADALSVSVQADRIREILANTTSEFISTESKSACSTVIAIGMGKQGVISRALNLSLSPVTHPLLPTRAAPGQLSLKEIRQMRTEMRVCTPKAFFLFGSPVTQSLSPRIHNTGFASLGLPHRYGLIETTSAVDVMKALHSTGDEGELSSLNFRAPQDEQDASYWTNATFFPQIIGGGNVTMPLKVDVLPLCDTLSPSARRIGAVNVLTVMHTNNKSKNNTSNEKGNRIIQGENTDWLGIYWPLMRSLRERRQALLGEGGEGFSKKEELKKVPALLVIGAGGTALAVAYAAMKLKLKLLVHNRTLSRAEELAKGWDAVIIPTLQSEDQQPDFPYEIVAIVCALPPSAQWTAPLWLLRNKPVVFDVCYRPRVTPLLAQAREAKCPVVEGVEMLIAQGVAAFSIWTGLLIEGTDDVEGIEVGPAVPVVEIAREVYKALEFMPDCQLSK